MLQGWRSLTFLHWCYQPEEIRRLLPPPVALDTFDGAAWVGLTPFLLVNLRPPFSPALPWISHFPETNVRTYVRGPDGERGVWFFTLEADRLLAVLAARALYRLPYRWANMRVEQKSDVIEYQSERRHPFGSARTRIAICAGDPMSATDFDNFLTARYRLYSMMGNRLAFAQIEHRPWPLHYGQVLQLDEDLIEQSGLPRPRGEPFVHCSPDLCVRIGRLQLA